MPGRRLLSGRCCESAEEERPQVLEVRIDPRLVPGVLFSSHKFVEDKPHIADVAPTILTLFGLQAPSHFDGKAWNLAS